MAFKDVQDSCDSEEGSIAGVRVGNVDSLLILWSGLNGRLSLGILEPTLLLGKSLLCEQSSSMRRLREAAPVSSAVGVHNQPIGNSSVTL